MALVALITATRAASEPGTALSATLVLAGCTIVERQARLAVAAGARSIIILVESLPGELVQAVERLRRDGLDVATARDAAEAAAAVPAGARLLMIADGLVGASGHLDRLLATGRPAILAIPDRGRDDRFERIDGGARWAGLALVDGALLTDAALMPAEWDVQSTLLRRALQTGVKPVLLGDADGAAELAIVERREDFAELQRRMVNAGVAGPASNWFSRFVLAPLERLVTTAVMATPLTPTIIGGGAAVLTGLGALAFARDWRWAGLVPLLLALPLEGVAVRLARLRLQPVAATAWWRLVLPVLSGAALVALGRSLMTPYGWGMLLLAAMTVAFLIALGHERQGRVVPGTLFLADSASLTALLLPFAAAGQWAAGLAFLFAYAAGSFFWAQYHVHRRAD